jgi:hypothetical protein
MDVANKNFKTPAEEKAEADKLVSEKLEADRKWQLEQEKLGQTDRLRDETERHNRAMEEKKSGGGGKLTQAQDIVEDLSITTKEFQRGLATKSIDANEIYRQGFQVNDDGTLFLDKSKRDVAGNPIVKPLPDFTDKLGKRGGPTALRAAWKQWNDADELQRMLTSSELDVNGKTVAQNLGASKNSGLWDRTKGTLENRISAWSTRVGLSENSKTVTVLRRMQMMASETRRQMLGSAVTNTELQTTLGWLLNPNDSYQAMMNKVNIVAKEGREDLLQFVNSYRNTANMTDWYSDLRSNRIDAVREFETLQPNESIGDMSDDELLNINM